MRILRRFFRRFCPYAATVALPFLCSGADKPENVVLQYHFIGATQLAQNTNVAAAARVFAQNSTIDFEDLVLDRLARHLAESLHFQTNKGADALLRPLLESVLLSESMASVSGSSGHPLDFVLAINLDPGLARTWQQYLKTINNGPGEELRAETFSGWQWNNGTSNSFWMVPAQDWLVVGRGESLASVRSDYLQQIQKSGRPGPSLDPNCFEADVDWPRLANWIPLSGCPLKLGQTHAAISAQDGNFHMTCQVTYPEAIQWQPHPMNLPTNLVHEPLTSFATGLNVEPFLKSDETLSGLCTNPLSDQFYFWSMGELAFESYVAWPAKDPSNTMVTLSTHAIEDLNPKLQKLDGTELKWMPKLKQLIWMKLPMIYPDVRPVPAKGGQFLVASLFPLPPGKAPAPQALWDQIDGRTNLVYYDWELTGPRVRHLLTVTQVLPILQMLGMGPSHAGSPEGKAPTALEVQSRLDIQEQWLAGLASFLGNTITEVTKTGPNELTVVRISPFVFNSLELVLLSHLLTDTPPGPIDWNLLPRAKMSGPGLPSH